MSLNLLRESKVYASTVKTGFSGAAASPNTWELNVLDGFSFTQGTNSNEITLNEAGTAPSRGKRAFNTALNPVDWSFTTYVRPFQRNDGTDDLNTAGERILWAALWGDGVADAAEGDNTASPKVVSMAVDTTSSNLAEPMKIQLYFTLESNKYHIEDAVVNSAEVDFSIDGIAQITWSGFGKVINDVTSGTVPTATSALALPSTADFIRNKLSTVVFKTAGVASPTTYSLAMTSGSISIENNITYLTPEEIGKLNHPIGAFLGTRNISGSISCYLNSGTTNSAGLYKSLVEGTSTENMYSIDMHMGGEFDASTNKVPSVKFAMPTVQLEIPSMDVQDVIATTINFSAQGATGSGATTAYDIAANNDATVDYYNSNSG